MPRKVFLTLILSFVILGFVISCSEGAEEVTPASTNSTTNTTATTITTTTTTTSTTTATSSTTSTSTETSTTTSSSSTTSTLSSWTKLLGTDTVESTYGIITSPDGNYIYITGYVTSTLDDNNFYGGRDILIAKYDVNGNKQWVRLLGTTDYDGGLDVIVSPDGNYIYLTGFVGGPLDDNSFAGISDIVIAKYDSSGNKQWTKLLGSTGSDAGLGIRVSPDGNFVYVAGWASGNIDSATASGEFDAFIAKYDSNGNKQWVKLLGTPTTDGAYEVLVFGTSLYLVGVTEGDLNGSSNNGGLDVFIAKYNTDGDKQWVKLFGSPTDDEAYAMAISPNGTSLYITGLTKGDLDGNTNNGDDDIFIARYDTNGNKIWIRQLGTPDIDQAYDLAVSPNDDYIYVTGYTKDDLDEQTNHGYSDAFIAKYDINGNKQWVKLFGSATNDEAHAITVSPDAASLYITGETYGNLGSNSNSGWIDIFIHKDVTTN